MVNYPNSIYGKGSTRPSIKNLYKDIDCLVRSKLLSKYSEVRSEIEKVGSVHVPQIYVQFNSLHERIVWNYLCYTPVTYSRNTPTEEPRINSGIVRSYPYRSVALHIVTVINRSSRSPCIFVYPWQFLNMHKILLRKNQL
jgi:hypothetical protein